MAVHAGYRPAEVEPSQVSADIASMPRAHAGPALVVHYGQVVEKRQPTTNETQQHPTHGTRNKNAQIAIETDMVAYGST
eukprot:1337628-Amphidinium_carterae.1